MGTFVLIHGSWHGGWCWEKISPLLEREGHVVVAPDLPGHGQDRTPIAETSLHSHVDAVCRLLEQMSEPVCLVGHSMGGMVITQAAEYLPEKIQTLVYLCAYLPQNGQSLSDLNRNNRNSLLSEHTLMVQGCRVIREEGLKKVFYEDCSDEDVEQAKRRLVPELTSSSVPVSVTAANYGGIPRIYIECLRDRAIDPELQRKMYADVPCAKVIRMDTGHSPFYAAPQILAKHLLELV